MISLRAIDHLYKTWIYPLLSGASLVACVWLGWMVWPTEQSGTDMREHPDITGTMLTPILTLTDKRSGDSWTLKASRIYHKDNTHYNLQDPRCWWNGNHGVVTLTGGHGYWNQTEQQGSLWNHVVVRYGQQDCMTSQQVNYWRHKQTLFSNAPTSGRYQSVSFRAKGFTWCSQKLSLRGPVRVVIND